MESLQQCGKSFFLRGPPTKGNECGKIRSIDFAIIIDRSIYRGNQSAGDNSDQEYNQFYTKFLTEIYHRTNFNYELDKVRVAVFKADSELFPHIQKSLTEGRHPKMKVHDYGIIIGSDFDIGSMNPEGNTTQLTLAFV